MRVEAEPKHWSVCKDRRRTSQGDVVVRHFGDVTPQERYPESAVKVSKAIVTLALLGRTVGHAALMIGVRLAQASGCLSLSPCRINYSRKVKLWYFGELRIWQFRKRPAI